MPTTKLHDIGLLSLDLKNYRTVPRPDEEHATNALIAIQPDQFWALMNSLLDDGFLPTENIIILKEGDNLTVKEGNRRVSSLKIIHGLIQNIDLPPDIQSRVDALGDEWKAANRAVPCAIYVMKDVAVVSKIVSRTHGKGEAAGRAPWKSVARARYARDEMGAAEPGLDLLEQYLLKGRNLNETQKERWAGDYSITVLDEAIQKLVPHLNYTSPADLVTQYPRKHRDTLESLMFDIGCNEFGFKEVRVLSPFWGIRYGVEPKAPPAGSGGTPNGSTILNVNTGGQAGGGSGGFQSGAVRPGVPASPANAAPGVPVTTVRRGANAALASTDPKAVRKALKAFRIRGVGREKIVTILDEIKDLSVDLAPHAFCFLLRCLFELSAKAYCKDHEPNGPKHLRADLSDRILVDVLRDVADHIKARKTTTTPGVKDKRMEKRLHGAMTELAKVNGMLSVTSLNQLVHHPSFSVSLGDICTLFFNVFPLFEEMNS